MCVDVLFYCFYVTVIVLIDDLFLHVRLRLDFAIRMRIIMSTSTALHCITPNIMQIVYANHKSASLIVCRSSKIS